MSRKHSGSAILLSERFPIPKAFGRNDIQRDLTYELLSKSSFSNDSSLIDLKEEAKKIASSSHISEIELNNTLHKGWQVAIEEAFDDGLLSEKEEERLGEMIEAFGFNKDSLNSGPLYVKMVKGTVLREVITHPVDEWLDGCEPSQRRPATCS